jgi:hypothetical protein
MKLNKIFRKITKGGPIKSESRILLSDFHRFFGGKHNADNLLIRGADLLDMVRKMNNNRTGI